MELLSNVNSMDASEKQRVRNEKVVFVIITNLQQGNFLILTTIVSGDVSLHF